MYKVKPARLSVESEVDTSYLHVMRPSTAYRKVIILVSQKIHEVVEIPIHGHETHALIDPCTINGDLM